MNDYPLDFGSINETFQNSIKQMLKHPKMQEAVRLIEEAQKSVSTAEQPPRGDLLDRAKETIVKDREDSYGSPEDSFNAIAEMWQAYLDARSDEQPLVAGDVAAMMTLLKVARMATGGLEQDDCWLDIAGYAACGFEVTQP